MILFFKDKNNTIFAVDAKKQLIPNDVERLLWLFGEAQKIDSDTIEGTFTGPRKEMITPWSTNAVEITQNMGIEGITRIEQFITKKDDKAAFDPMLQNLYNGLNQTIFTINKQPDPIIYINDIAEYNQQEGLALNPDEIEYLESVSKTIGRKLTDSEVFGFSQVNSEHCRHKIFNGTFIIDKTEKNESLFQLIKKTSKINHDKIVSAYKDNVAFIEGPVIEQFAPEKQDIPDFFTIKEIETVLSLKAETHNFPTTVEPFNGAATGSGGEIRDRMAGGTGSIPMAGTAVYMTSYPRLDDSRKWETSIPARNWLYQTPQEILTKASNGASDFGNKFGQPLICGSLFTFEHFEGQIKTAFDKVIMLAGGIGYGVSSDSHKHTPHEGDLIVVMGGDNYRIGMGGGAVSSVATGEYNKSLELNAVQRSNPEMQKRVFNAVRALVESSSNLIVSIHDHGAGGHLNSLSELVEETGGIIYIDKLPIGDSTLSAKEIIGNESQERMGLIIAAEDIDLLKNIAARERAPMFIVGKVTNDMRFTFIEESENNESAKPIDLKLDYLFGKPPKTIINDQTQTIDYKKIDYDIIKIEEYLEQVLQIEAVACKDWLTNKVDRSVTGKIALQQTVGQVQLPLNNLGIVALDYTGTKGLATSIGHAPAIALTNPEKGSVMSIAEALTNIIWAPVKDGLKGISLSANWMWPCKNSGEDARLYKAVEAAANFAIDLGINIPTGKDSLSMTQKYPDGDSVMSPGTVIISAAGEVSDVKKVVTPVLKNMSSSHLIYINLSKCNFSLTGSSFAQIIKCIGDIPPTVADTAYFVKVFETIQYLVNEGKILAGHDISSGGIITTLLEMCFPQNNAGMDLDLSQIKADDIVQLLFSENPGLIIQADDSNAVENYLEYKGVEFYMIGQPLKGRKLQLSFGNQLYVFDIDILRNAWFKTSYLLDSKQTLEELAYARFKNFSEQEQNYVFNPEFSGKAAQFGIDMSRRVKTGIKAAIIREKGVNGDREMAYSMYLAGFDVKDVHITDLISGRETLEDIHFIVFVGGFSNSDVLGSAKGWAGAFLYNEKAKKVLDNFYKRGDTMSLGICNGCQLMVELDLIYPDHPEKPKMLHNDSHKFESAFLSVDILENNSVMLNTMDDARLGVWVAHGDGKFSLPYDESEYNIPVKYTYSEYPGNPNGSEYNAAAICSADGRHLAMMPHLERSVLPFQWAYYPETRKADEISPWIEAFVNARKWIETKKYIN